MSAHGEIAVNWEEVWRGVEGGKCGGVGCSQIQAVPEAWWGNIIIQSSALKLRLGGSQGAGMKAVLIKTATMQPELA